MKIMALGWCGGGLRLGHYSPQLNTLGIPACAGIHHFLLNNAVTPQMGFNITPIFFLPLIFTIIGFSNLMCLINSSSKTGMNVLRYSRS